MNYRRRGGRAGAGTDARAPFWLVALTLAVAVAVVVTGATLAYAYKTRDSQPTTGVGAQIQALQRAVRNNPGDYVSRRNLAFVLQQAGRDREALAQYRKVLAAYPNDLATLYSIGVIDLHSWFPGRGVNELLHVLQLSPTHSLAAKTLGEYYVAKKQYADAIKVLLPAADAHPDLADLQVLLGQAYEGAGQAELAAKRYRAALAFLPTLAAAKAGLSRVGGAQ